LALFPPSETRFGSLISTLLSAGERADLLRQFRAVQKRKPFYGCNLQSVSELCESTGIFNFLKDKNLQRPLYEDLFQSAWGALEAHALGPYLDKLFAKAIADKSITAWIVANDAIGNAGVKFLGERGIKIPGDVAMTSFDNMPESFQSRLSSYDFNIAGIVQEMIAFIQRKGTGLMQCKSPVVEIEGRIIERESTETTARR
jgi:DNA-binding LacI/PurR family transcriptional regulator